MEYRLDNGGPLIESGERLLDGEEFAELQEAWDDPEQKPFDDKLLEFGCTVVTVEARPEPTPDTHVMVPIEEYDRLRRVAGEL
jgi:hypothetical protein